MSKNHELDLTNAIERYNEEGNDKYEMSIDRIHKTLLKKGIKITYGTLLNYNGTGSQQAPRAFEVLNIICDILKVTPNELLK